MAELKMAAHNRIEQPEITTTNPPGNPTHRYVRKCGGMYTVSRHILWPIVIAPNVALHGLT